MPQGLRPGDAQTMLHLTGGDRRLFMRLGNLLQTRLSLSETVLAECQREPALRKLLLARALGDCADDAAFQQLCQAHDCQDLGLVLVPSDDWRVILFEDELENPLLAESDTGAKGSRDWHTPVAELLPTLHRAVRTPVEGLLAAQGDEQRAAALEQLRYAAPPMAVVTELMPLVLADSADSVRERAVALLVAAGVHPAVVDLIRALQRGDDDAVSRLAVQLPPSLGPAQSELLLAGIMTVLANAQMGPGLIRLAIRLSSELANHRGLERFIQLACMHAGGTSLVPCIRALQQHNAAAVDASLRAQFGQNDKLDADLIVLLASPEAAGNTELLQRGVELLLNANEQPTDRMSLAQALRRIDRDGLLAKELASQRHQIPCSRDATIYWLAAELASAGQVDADSGNALAQTLIQVLKEGIGPHLVAILDQTLPALLPCDDAIRTALVDPLAELVIRFKDERSLDLVRCILRDMGLATETPLWRLLEEHPQLQVRCLASEVLAQLLTDQNDARISAAVRRLLQAAKQDDRQMARIAIVDAAAELCIHLQDDQQQLANEIDSHCEVFGVQAIEAQAVVAGSGFITAERRLAILDKMVRLLTAEVPESRSEEIRDPATDEITYVLNPQLGAHTDLVPRVLRGLRVLATSEHLPAPAFRRLVQTLNDTWRKVASWQVIWGPGNVYELALHMGQVAQLERCPSSMRKQLAQALVPRAGQLTIAAILARICAVADGSSLADIAATCCQRLIRAATRNEYADDELGELIHILAAFLAIGDLGDAADRLRGQLVSLITSSRQYCDKRGRERLRFLRDDLPEHLAARLDWA
jgi:hypothetical protein